jgi:hypothetical protein
MLFKAIAKRQYRRTWDAMNRHDYEIVVRQFTSDFEVTFIGDT